MRDKIVFSATGKLQELLLREDELDFQRFITICRAFEQSNKHLQEIRDTHENTFHKINSKDEHSNERNKEDNRFWEPDLEQMMKGKAFH